MPKFRTPYDTLLRVRRIEEDKAKAALAEANLGLRRAQETLDADRAYYARVSSPTHGETAIGGFLASAAHAAAAAREVGVARAHVEEAADSRGLAVEATRVASMRTQGLERLVERAHEAHVQEMLAADQRTAEESMAGARRRTGSRPAARGTAPEPDPAAQSTAPHGTTPQGTHRQQGVA